MCCVNTTDIVSKITCHSLGPLLRCHKQNLVSGRFPLCEGRFFQDGMKVLGSRMEFHVLYTRVFEQMFNCMISLMTWIHLL